MRFIKGGGRGRKWPTVDLYATAGRGDIKALSPPGLEHLMAVAREKGWNAVGRPAWSGAHRDRVRSMWMVVFGPEGSALLRCIVIAVLDDGSGGSFTLDVLPADFDRLPDATPEEQTMLAHMYLAGFPPLELDPDQRES
jgi:hypothetical protein